MAESACHLFLVEAIVAWVVRQKLCESTEMVDVDKPGSIRRPPTLGGYVPDVYVNGGRGEVVGEAKTPADLESPHTIEQLHAFLKYCCLAENTVFVLAVPWYVERLGRSVVTHTKRRYGLVGAQAVVLERLPDAYY